MAKDKIEDAVDKAISRRWHDLLYKGFRNGFLICITTTLALSGMLYKYGIYLYNNSEATKAAIDTFIEVKKRNENL